jgi:hypothetical protein
VCAADGDSATTAKARRRLAAAMCKRLQDLLTCLRVLVGTIVAMPAVIDQQVIDDGPVYVHKMQMLHNGLYTAAVHLSKSTIGRAKSCSVELLAARAFECTD